MAMTSTIQAPLDSVAPAPPNGPVPKLTQRIIELLRVEQEDLVVDLYGRDCESHQEIPEEVRPYDQMIALSPFSEQLAFRLITSGVRMVQMGTLTFGRFPMRYEQVVLRDGFSQFNDSLRRLLAAVLRQLEPAGRVLIVDSAPSPDAPLFAEGLRRWNRQHRSPELIAELMRESGFSAQVETVACVRRVSAAKCYAWLKSRDWPILESFRASELHRGECELRARYGSEQMVNFTSRFDLVLGTKPKALAS
jgi:hypothetical protein